MSFYNPLPKGPDVSITGGWVNAFKECGVDLDSELFAKGVDMLKLLKYIQRRPAVNQSARGCVLGECKVDIIEAGSSVFSDVHGLHLPKGSTPGDGIIWCDPYFINLMEVELGHQLHGGFVGQLMVPADCVAGDETGSSYYLKGRFQAFKPLSGSFRFVTGPENNKLHGLWADVNEPILEGLQGSYCYCSEPSVPLQLVNCFEVADRERQEAVYQAVYKNLVRHIEQYKLLAGGDVMGYLDTLHDVGSVLDSTDLGRCVQAIIDSDKVSDINSEPLVQVFGYLQLEDILSDFIKARTKGQGYYIMIAPDPTGKLKAGEVCLIGVDEPDVDKVTTARYPIVDARQVTSQRLNQSLRKELEQLMPNTKGLVVSRHDESEFLSDKSGGDYDDHIAVFTEDVWLKAAYPKASCPDYEAAGHSFTITGESLEDGKIQKLADRAADAIMHIGMADNLLRKVNAWIHNLRREGCDAYLGDFHPDKVKEVIDYAEEARTHVCYQLQNSVDFKLSSQVLQDKVSAIGEDLKGFAPGFLYPEGRYNWMLGVRQREMTSESNNNKHYPSFTDDVVKLVERALEHFFPVSKGKEAVLRKQREKLGELLSDCNIHEGLLGQMDSRKLVAQGKHLVAITREQQLKSRFNISTFKELIWGRIVNGQEKFQGFVEETRVRRAEAMRRVTARAKRGEDIFDVRIEEFGQCNQELFEKYFEWLPDVTAANVALATICWMIRDKKRFNQHSAQGANYYLGSRVKQVYSACCKAIVRYIDNR